MMFIARLNAICDALAMKNNYLSGLGLHLFARRAFIKQASIMTAGGLAPWALTAGGAESRWTLPFGNGERPLVVYPQKRPLIRLTTRPPQLETPFSVFRENILTPNDAFFVRYHLANIPLAIDPDNFRLSLGGLVERPLQLSLQDLRSKFPQVEIVAVNQCSGNSRGFIEPRVAGGQSGHGAMGNARWRGVRLKDVLQYAGVRAGAKQVSFRGLDAPIMPTTPAFIKALPIDHALSEDVLLAFMMNGEALPMLNGFPLRLVVPGYFGTYWIKHLSEIQVLNHEFDGFFMSKAYRVPANTCSCVEPETEPAATIPISRMVVRSFITSLDSGAAIPSNQPTRISGIAFDGGSGIRDVAVSLDGGQTWQAASLGEDLGAYSFRPWHTNINLPRKGNYELLVRASNRSGETQPLQYPWNPAGYRYNAVERTKVIAL